MITSLKEMLELPNFDHMTKFIIQIELHNKILLMTAYTEIRMS